MKLYSLLYLTSLCFTSAALADQTLSYPAKKPLLSFVVPDDWEAESKDGSLFVLPPGDDEGVIVEVMTLEADLDDHDGAVEEAKETVEDFKGLTFEDGEGAETNGLTVSVINGKGKDEDGQAFINFLIVKNPKAKSHLLLSIISSPEGAEKHQKVIVGILSSIGAAAAAPAKTTKTQTYSYPDKDSPVFAIDFPADWKMEAEAESAYVVSPDKLVAMNVLLIDQAELPVAVGHLKKQTGEKYGSIEWAAEPSVQKDEALKLTAKFHHGMAQDGEKKYSVNIAEYAKEGGKKFLVLISQHPLEALKEHAEAIEGVVQSIKVK